MKRSISEVELLINETRAELYLLRVDKQKALEARVTQIEALEKKLFDSRRTFARFSRKNSVRLHTYSVAIQEVRSGERQSRNMMSLEGQLCQAIHQMSMQDNQLKIIQNSTADTLTDHQMSYDEVLRGKQMGEHVLMKEIVELDDSKKAEEERLVEKKIEGEEYLQILKSELQERFPLLFPPEVNEEETKGQVEDTKARSFFKAAKKRMCVLNPGGNFQSIGEKGVQQNITILSPAFSKNKEYSPPDGEVRKGGSRLAFISENRSLTHMMSSRTAIA